jgi:hypothetical protein
MAITHEPDNQFTANQVRAGCVVADGLSQFGSHAAPLGIGAIHYSRVIGERSRYFAAFSNQSTVAKYGKYRLQR